MMILTNDRDASNRSKRESRLNLQREVSFSIVKDKQADLLKRETESLDKILKENNNRLSNRRNRINGVTTERTSEEKRFKQAVLVEAALYVTTLIKKSDIFSSEFITENADFSNETIVKVLNEFYQYDKNAFLFETISEVLAVKQTRSIDDSIKECFDFPVLTVLIEEKAAVLNDTFRNFMKEMKTESELKRSLMENSSVANRRKLNNLKPNDVELFIKELVKEEKVKFEQITTQAEIDEFQEKLYNKAILAKVIKEATALSLFS